MTQEHPITPPPELVQQWWEESNRRQYTIPEAEEHVVSMAAQWGADQELEACLGEVSFLDGRALADRVRAARRPKSPSLKRQALDPLDKAEDPSWDINDFSIVRRALEQLPDSIVVFPSQCQKH